MVSRSVRDSAILLDAIHGPEVGGPYIIAPPERPYAQEIEREPGKLRIAFSTRSPINTPVHPECRKAAEDAARLLESLGHHVEEAEPEIDGDALADDFLSIYFAMAGAAVAETKAETGCGNEGFELDTLGIAAMGRALSAPDYVAIHGRWNTYSRALGEFYTRYDFFMTPTPAMPPSRIGELDTRFLDRLGMQLLLALNLGKPVLKSGYVHKVAREQLKWVPFTQLANLTTTPAMSVPLHWTENGLPIGVQFNAAMGDEGRLFSLAAQLERAKPWAGRRPPVFAA